MKKLAIHCVILAICAGSSAAATAQDATDDQDDQVIIPSQMELNDEERKELEAFVAKELSSTLTTCVGKYPRPELFTQLAVQFELKKSGSLRGGYTPTGGVDSSMYVKTDEEKAKREEAGSFTRLVVRSDRDLERCLQTATRQLDTKFKRYSATVAATFDVSWKGKTPTLNSTAFVVTKN